MTQVWENECSEAARSWSSERPLTHLIDLTDRQDDMKVTRACSVAGCDRPHKARGWCGFHYDRWFAGLPLDAPARGYGQTQCAVADCDRKHRSGGYCPLHYKRFKKHGTAMPTVPAAAPRWQGPARACSYAGCDRPRKANGWCGMHRLRELNGKDMSAPPKGTVIGYNAAHQRVSAEYGRAAERTCVDCTSPAHQWSYTYGDPNEQRDPTRGCAYSGNPAFYVARCRHCHADFDRSQRQQRDLA